jgi:hypothetical protein
MNVIYAFLLGQLSLAATIIVLLLVAHKYVLVKKDYGISFGKRYIPPKNSDEAPQLDGGAQITPHSTVPSDWQV